ncbi:Vps62-related protein [Marininema halotolerans]|uniref:DUF946 domain-containing protein n=1 Tax=Marininema halotolerans TaxID=1155944 RepID=A0A1I6TTL1_9BACL|nr:Vps62-related protein [Marininema halotolerans]SFS92589.1 protein of unknown function [Marininema halotolerans]
MMRRIAIGFLLFFLVGSHGALAKTSSVKSSSSKEPQQLIETYAPRLIFDQSENYYPLSVDNSFMYLEREMRDGQYSLRTIEKLKSTNSKLSFFKGDLSASKVYAYYIKRSDKVVDIVYWIFYPYNEGKKVFWYTIGNHVGDWEHVTVRLTDQVPTHVYFSAHSGGESMSWKDTPKTQDTHPVAYVARGSHGMYKNKGKHVYGFSLGRLIDVVDYTSDGVIWNIWEKNGLSTFTSMDNGQTYSPSPSWMRRDFSSTIEGKNEKDPTGGAINRWGNASQGTCFGSECELNSGPTGPSAKDSIMRNSPDNPVN